MRIWQRSFNLAVKLYKKINLSKNFSVKDQMIRSSLSVPSNIAEDFERESNKEYVRFLDFAKGSNGELRTQLLFAKERGMIDEREALPMIMESKEISKMISGLIKSRKLLHKK